MRFSLTLSSTLKSLAALALTLGLSMATLHGVQSLHASDGTSAPVAKKMGGPPGSWAS